MKNLFNTSHIKEVVNKTVATVAKLVCLPTTSMKTYKNITQIGFEMSLYQIELQSIGATKHFHMYHFLLSSSLLIKPAGLKPHCGKLKNKLLAVKVKTTIT